MSRVVKKFGYFFLLQEELLFTLRIVLALSLDFMVMHQKFECYCEKCCELLFPENNPNWPKTWYFFSTGRITVYTQNSPQIVHTFHEDASKVGMLL